MGIAAGAGRAVIFRKGQKTRVVSAEDMLSALMEEVQAVAAGAATGDSASYPGPSVRLQTPEPDMRM